MRRSLTDLARSLIVLPALCLLTLPTRAAEPRHLTLEEALALLERQNPTHARAEAQVRQAEAAGLQARSLILPSLGVAGSYTRNNAAVELPLGDLLAALAAANGQPPPADIPETVVLQPLDAFSASATLRVPLLAPSAYPAVSASRKRADAARAGTEATRRNLRASVVQACWLEASAMGYIRAAEATVARAREYAAGAERAVQAGTGTSLEMLRARTEVVRREGDLVQARAALEKARLSLGLLLGLAEPVQVDMPVPEAPVAPDAEALSRLAIERRSEMEAAQAAVDAAKRQLQAERLALAPGLSGALSGFASNVPYPTGEQVGWQATVNLSWSIYQGGARSGKILQAKAALAEAGANLEQQRLLVAQQVRNAVADLEVARQKLELSRRQRELAEEASKSAQRAFDAGTLGSMELLDALDRLDLARVGEQDSLARLGMAAVALQAATGEW